MEGDKLINELTHKIIGCAMEVHNHLGNGFQEVIYQRSLVIEFGLQGISFAREMEMDFMSCHRWKTTHLAR